MDFDRSLIGARWFDAAGRLKEWALQYAEQECGNLNLHDHIAKFHSCCNLLQIDLNYVWRLLGTNRAFRMIEPIDAFENKVDKLVHDMQEEQDLDNWPPVFIHATRQDVHGLQYVHWQHKHKEEAKPRLYLELFDGNHRHEAMNE